VEGGYGTEGGIVAFLFVWDRWFEVVGRYCTVLYALLCFVD
jgi:hypothetical protein